jgi:signal transduction histidine kinase
MVFLLGFAVTVQVRLSLADALSRELQSRGTSIARDVAARGTDLILTNDLFALHELVRDTLENNPDVRYVLVLDAKGGVLAHTFGRAVPPDLLLANYVGVRQRARVETLDTEEGLIHDAAVPVFEGRAGTARVGMSTRKVGQMLDTVTRYVLLATLLVSLAGVLAAYVLTQVLTRPLLELRQSARRVGAGEFSERARVWSKDEIGQLTAAFNAMTESLQQMQRELQRKEEMRLQLLDKIMTAQEEERKRIARELHDETSQSLTSLMVGLKVLDAKCVACPWEEAKAHVGKLSRLTRDTLDEVHRLALELRPSVLDDWGLVVALQRYVDDFAAKAGLDVDCQMLGLDSQRLPPQVEIALYRIVQEALTNVVRHARAQHVSVVLKRQRASVLAIVEDDGAGFDVAKVMGAPASNGRLGLFGMQERAALLGGTLTLESSPDAGTTVFVEIPLNESMGQRVNGSMGQQAHNIDSLTH